MATLIQNCQGDSAGVEKFSGVSNNRTAAARRPTTAGRKPKKMCSTVGWLLYFIRNLEINNIRMKEAHRHPVVVSHDFTLNHGDHGIAATKAEEADEEEGAEQLEINHVIYFKV